MAKAFDCGRYSWPIEIQEYTEAVDEYGEPIKLWATFTSTWASFMCKGGNEAFNAKHFSAEVDAIFRFAYLPGVKNTMRILFNDNYYDIKFINPMGHNEALEVLARAVVE